MVTCSVLVLTEQRVVALHGADRVRPCPCLLLPSPGEKISLSLFQTPFFTPSLNRTCLMSWHLFFQFLYNTPSPPFLLLPQPPLHHFPFMPALEFSCFSFSSSSNVLPAGIHNAPEGTEEHYHPLLSRNSFSHRIVHILTFTVPHSLPRI